MDLNRSDYFLHFMHVYLLCAIAKHPVSWRLLVEGCIANICLIYNKTEDMLSQR